MKPIAKLIYLPLIFIFLFSAKLSAQTSDMARPGPKGIFLFLGKNVPCGKTTSAFRIERRTKDGAWKQVTDVKAPATLAEFNNRLDAARALFPVQPIPSGEKLEGIFQQAIKIGNVDSVKGWQNIYPVRLALGISYFDADARDGNGFQYKITELNPAGLQKNLLISNTVSMPYNPKYDAIELAESSQTDKFIYIKWRSTGKSAAPLFMVLKFENQKPVLAKGKTIRYTDGDTTFYVFQDSLAKIQDQNLQYFLTPYDEFGNSGKSTNVVVITKEIFNKAIFLRTHASKLSDGFGIRISWKFSNPGSAKSIDVYKSELPDKDFKKLVSLSPDDTLYTDESIKPDKVYYYMLQANQRNGSRIKQSNKIFSVAYNPAKPIPPAINAAIGIKDGVKLFIDATDVQAAGIRIYRNDGIHETMTPVSDLIRKTNNSRIIFTDTSGSLSGRLTYKYGVRTESTSYVLSDLSATAMARPLISSAPSSPSYIKAYSEDGTIKLYWENMQQNDPGIAGYRITRRTENNLKNGESPFSPIAGDKMVYVSNFFIDSTVVPGNTYTYEIEAIDIDNNHSSQKTRASVSLQEDLPIAPGGITLINVPEGIRMEWAETSYKGMQSYKLYRYQRGITPALLTTLPAAAKDYTDTTLQKGQLYFFYLTTVNKSGKESARSEEAGITK
jgi:fibronectin type 3 domain-containing protein